MYPFSLPAPLLFIFDFSPSFYCFPVNLCMYSCIVIMALSVLFSHHACLKRVTYKGKEKASVAGFSFMFFQKRVVHCYANGEHVAQGNC